MRCVFIFVSVGLWAQQTSPATYDTDRKVKLQGAVTRIDWTNPRAYLFVNAKDSAGLVENWAVEIGNPLELEKAGWKSSAVKIGDAVTVEGSPARGLNQRALAAAVTRNGARVFAIPSRQPVGPSVAAVPRWPDGHVRLGTEPGKKGYWGVASSSVLIQNSAGAVAMSRDGVLSNLTDVGKVAPFLPWAKSVYEYRQRSLLKDDPILRCLPPGGPRQFQTANGFQFIEQPELGRILVLLGGGDRNWRVIYTDGRPLAQGDDLVLTYYGTSVGHWDGKDALVVESVGFNERFWMSAGGLPHTEALKLTERFSRPDFNTLKYEVTVDDPRTYLKPWSGGWTVRWVPDEDMQEYFCEENAEATFVR
jgi:Family of unknown function (DUF6152)